MASACQCLLLFFLIAGLCNWGEASYDIIDVEMARKHELWMTQYGRVYKDTAEKELRFEIFKENMKYIEDFNAEGHNYTLAINQFGDLTNEEFIATHTGLKDPQTMIVEPVRSIKYETTEEVEAVPSRIDWRTRRAVTPVRDQGRCGSCWAFTTVAAMESLIKIKKGVLYYLSEQELVDCDKYNNGCHGGNLARAFNFIIRNRGLTARAKYPYKGIRGQCHTNMLNQSVATIRGYKRVVSNRESSLMAAVAQQPVAVSIDAGGRNFQFYKSGVFTGYCGTRLNHAVTVVGYGTTGWTKYWIAKNSWGTSWGEAGYIRMKKDVRAPQGLCGIAMQPIYPTV